MSKELDALERLYCAGNLALDYVCSDKHKEDYEIVEKALKENEQLKTSYLENLLNEQSKEYIYKKLKALEIIKTKPQATLWLIQVCDREMEYEDMIYFFKEDITKEQFDLLKEVLK